MNTPDDTEVILSLIKNNPQIRQTEIVATTGMSLSKVKRMIADLRNNGTIVREGNNRNGSWIIKD